MDHLEETISLDLEESNELAFKIKIEGSAPSSSPAKVRLVCEGAENISYMFNGYSTGEDDIVEFNLPKMKDKLTEGLYQSRVEVLIDNRFFSPVQFQINFKKAVKVVAESIQVNKSKKQDISVTASPIFVKQPVKVVEQPKLVIESKKEITPVEKTETVVDHKKSVSTSSSPMLKERYEDKNQSKKESKQNEESIIREMARNIMRGKFR